MNRTTLFEGSSQDPKAFIFDGYSVEEPEAPYFYKPRRGAPQDIQWPPKGLRLDAYFKTTTDDPIKVVIHYEVYDNYPILVKWIEILPTSGFQKDLKINIIAVEELNLNLQWASPSILVNHENPQAGSHGYGWLDITSADIYGVEIKWTRDPEDTKSPGSFQPVVTCGYSSPNMSIPLNNGFKSYRVHELLIGTNEQERSGLAKRKMTRLLAPQTQENPLFFHMTNLTTDAIHMIVDQMSEVGFDMLIFSFGSGFDLESENKTYLDTIKTQIAYANSRGIEVGGYDLIALSRKVDNKWMSIQNGKIGNSACFASDWSDFL